jgi:flagellin-like protein
VQNKKMKNFNRNLKAISPIFATLILIAIAVIAGVVVYMFTSGTLATMTGGGTAAQEKVAVQGASIKVGGIVTGQVTVYAQSTNTQAVTIDSMIVKDSAGNTVTVLTPLTSATLSGDGSLVTVSYIKSPGRL